MKRIYLDYAATTPVLASVAEAMQPWLSSAFGNPSSLYAEGREARRAIDSSRETIAEAFGCLFGEVVFTSSGTEAANLAIIGAALAHGGGRDTIVLSAAEHHCVLNTRPTLERLGYVVRFAPVDRVGRVDLTSLETMIADRTLLVGAMHANNETGVFNDVEAVGALCRQHGALFFCDAVQTFPDHRIDADMTSVSAHKFGGPKGAGALYIKAGTPLKPVAVGGGQEREMRAGTENVSAIVGMAEAVRCVLGDDKRVTRKEVVRRAFCDVLSRSSIDTVETAPGEKRLPGHFHCRFPGVSSESLLILLDRMGVSASAGSACSSGSIEPSHVLLAAGWGNNAEEGVRFTFGAETSPEDAEEAAKRVTEAVAQLARSKARR